MNESFRLYDSIISDQFYELDVMHIEKESFTIVN